MGDDGAVRCTFAPKTNKERVERRALAGAMSLVNPHASSGLTLLFNGTPAVHAHPAAKAAIERAAASWEAIIETPMTVVIDIDFSPSFFGFPYKGDTLGETDALDTSISYQSVRLALQASAVHATESELFERLPSPTVPTDTGAASTLLATQANLRALGLRPASPSPADENPMIGLNSEQAWDFDRSDGVLYRADFEAVVTHEIGHVLGFVSSIGYADTPSVLDLFRLRPGSSLDDFATATRIQTPGGEHRFAVPAFEVPFSTWGDGQDASHWKDDEVTDWNIGLMDPTMRQSRYQTATLFDALALDLIGYAVRYPTAPLAPSNLYGVSTAANSMQLTWSDNATNESDQRLDVFDGTTWVEIRAVGPDRTNIVLTTLYPSRTYTFRLRASNSGGFSDPSNQVSATTRSADGSPRRRAVRP